MNKQIHFATHLFKKYREERDWSQHQMAEFLQLNGVQISQGMISKIEEGKRGLTAQRALELSKATKIPVMELVMRKDV